MNKILGFIVTIVFLSACASPSTPQAIDQMDVQKTALSVSLTNVVMTQTAMAPTATKTPAPPTKTPRPTATRTPAPEPIVLSGSGNSVVDVSKWNGIALLKSTYSGSSNFIVESYNANNEQIDLLINTIGSYSGTVLFDRYDDEDTTRLQIQASGPWEIAILPINEIRMESIPGVFQGNGDDVVFLDYGSLAPDLLKVDASQGSSNFIVYGFSDQGFDLVVNEIAPYTGVTIIQDSTKLLQILAEGPWSIEVTAR